MTKYINKIGIAIFFILVLFSFGFSEESFTITTYYPSPYGSYNDLYVANRLGIGTTRPRARLEIAPITRDNTVIQLGELNNISWCSENPTVGCSISGYDFTNQLLFYAGDGSGGALMMSIGYEEGVQANKLSVGYANNPPDLGMIVYGKVGIGTASPGQKVHVSNSSLNVIALRLDQNIAESSTQYFLQMYRGGASNDNEFLFRTDGTASADGAWSGGGADYAEWFEKEGNIPPKELVGINLKTGKVRLWQKGDPLVGIYSTNPGFIGNNIAAEMTKEDMQKTHVLVALIGQVELESKNILEESRKVMTIDGQFVGWKLSNGKIFLK